MAFMVLYRPCPHVVRYLVKGIYTDSFRSVTHMKPQFYVSKKFVSFVFENTLHVYKATVYDWDEFSGV